MKAKAKTKNRFSVMELICVVAIVMTLMSVLITSIKSSKDMAIQVACMSNISQIRTYTELYRKDNRQLPYSEIWLTDFSYAADYMEGAKAELKTFICPGSEDEHLTSTDQLKYNTSYYYVPGRAVLENNITDGQAYGFSLLNIAALSSKNQLVIYDKSPDHHNGKINTAYLFGDDEPAHSLEGQITSDTGENFAVLDGAGQLDLPDADSYGSLNINPANSSGNLFTLTDPDGNVIEIRDDSIAGTGKAVNITIKVKAQGRTLEIGADTIELKTNTTYDVSATSDDESIDPYYIYELSQEGNGTGQWWIDLFVGVGTITVTDTGTGTSTTVTGDGTATNGNSGKSKKK